MAITAQGIKDHSIKREEFELLGMIDRRHFINSANERFGEWKSSFVVEHPDWPLRVEVQDELAKLTCEAIKSSQMIGSGGRLRILFTGASLGSVATYFHAARLSERGWLDKFDVEITDLLAQPLEMTKAGRFHFDDRSAAATGVSAFLSAQDYKSLLARAEIWPADVVDLAHAADATFDVVVSPYLHHHLNLLDKKTACEELLRVTRPGGLCVIGDLTFGYEEFVRWLAKHSVEDVPYALECFISRREHEALFAQTTPVHAMDGSFYYGFALRRGIVST